MNVKYKPLMSMIKNSIGDGEYDSDLAVLDPILEPKNPQMTAIIIHNDDYTTMEFVVWVLMSVLRLDETSAVTHTMNIHHTGQACVAVLPHEIAQSKANKIRLLAEKEEFPLMITLRPK